MKKLLALVGCASIVLTACGGPRDEKQAFIDATIEATCHIFQAENIFDPKLEEEAKEIYSNYGFDAEDDAAMEALSEKYNDDEEVQTAIMDGLEECGGDLFSGLEEAFQDMGDEEAVSDEGMMEDADMMDADMMDEGMMDEGDMMDGEGMMEEGQ